MKAERDISAIRLIPRRLNKSKPGAFVFLAHLIQRCHRSTMKEKVKMTYVKILSVTARSRFGFVVIGRGVN